MRLVLFTDANTTLTSRMVRALRRLPDGFRLAAVVTASPASFPSAPTVLARAYFLRGIRAASNREVAWASVRDAGIDLRRAARRIGVPFLVTPTNGPNDPEFVRRLKADVRPDVALSCLSRHRFRRALRDAFACCVNVHDGALPDFRGVMATAFSIFEGAPRSGITFHYMNAGIDEGPVLFEDGVPLDATSTLDRVNRLKSRIAADALHPVLVRVAGGDPGRPQADGGRYFSVHDWHAWTHLSRPENVTRAQILRRLRAFGVLHLTVDGESWPVSRLRDAQRGARRAFRTEDGHWLRPDRFHGLPFSTYRLFRGAWSGPP